MTDDPRAALMAALREMAEDWCVAGMEHAEDLLLPRAGVTLTREAKEGGREWVRDYFSAPEDVAEDEQIQAVLAAVDAIEAAARESAERSPDAW